MADKEEDEPTSILASDTAEQPSSEATEVEDESLKTAAADVTLQENDGPQTISKDKTKSTFNMVVIIAS